jgi:fluoroacetyl-CoA thioesterase
MKASSEIEGAVGFSSMTIRPGDTNIALGLGDLPIAAVSLFTNLAESAALTAINEFLDAGETTRLTTFTLESNQAVAIGAVVRATATCTKVDGRVISFDCEIHEGEREIGKAKMERAVVERVSFLARTAAQSIIGQQSN